MTLTTAPTTSSPPFSQPVDGCSPMDVPNEYICPISLEVMKNPVMDKNGRSFEKSAILEWLNRGNTHCPLTRQPLKPSSLIPNYSLKLSIDTWKRQQNGGVDKLDMNNDDDDDKHRFVGLVSCPPEALLAEASARFNNSTYHQRSAAQPENGQRHSNNNDEEYDSVVEDDLSDLLALYNEVLELTSTPLDSPLLRREHGSSQQRQQQHSRQRHHQESSVSSPSSPSSRSQQNEPTTSASNTSRSSTTLFSINMDEPVNAAVQRSIDRRRRQEIQQIQEHIVQQHLIHEMQAEQSPITPTNSNSKKGKVRWPKVQLFSNK